MAHGACEFETPFADAPSLPAIPQSRGHNGDGVREPHDHHSRAIAGRKERPPDSHNTRVRRAFEVSRNTGYGHSASAATISGPHQGIAHPVRPHRQNPEPLRAFLRDSEIRGAPEGCGCPGMLVGEKSLYACGRRQNKHHTKIDQHYH